MPWLQWVFPLKLMLNFYCQCNSIGSGAFKMWLGHKAPLSLMGGFTAFIKMLLSLDSLPLSLHHGMMQKKGHCQMPACGYWTSQLSELWVNKFLTILNYAACGILLKQHKTKTVIKQQLTERGRWRIWGRVFFLGAPKLKFQASGVLPLRRMDAWLRAFTEIHIGQ